VHAALVHERAGHHGVVDEVTRNEPVVRGDVGLADDEAVAERSALGLEPGDPVDQSHLVARNGEWAAQIEAGEVGPERSEVSGAQRIEGRGVERGLGQRAEGRALR